MDYPEYYTEEELMIKIRRCSPFGDIEDFEMRHNLFRLRINHIWWLGNLETGEIKCGFPDWKTED